MGDHFHICLPYYSIYLYCARTLLSNDLHLRPLSHHNTIFLTQYVREATRNESVLDLVITSEPDIIQEIEVLGSLRQATTIYYIGQ